MTTLMHSHRVYQQLKDNAPYLPDAEYIERVELILAPTEVARIVITLVATDDITNVITKYVLADADEIPPQTPGG